MTDISALAGSCPTYLHLLANGISQWRLEMTDLDGTEMPAATIINESTEQ